MNTQIAYCGVNCFACSDYINKICPSCKHTQWTEEDICMPVKCCKEKGIDFCAFCNNFPCDDMADFYEESKSHKEAYHRMVSMNADH